MVDKIKLQGFNNLTKSLSFCIYDICYAETPEQKKEYARTAYLNKKVKLQKIKEINTLGII